MSDSDLEDDEHAKKTEARSVATPGKKKSACEDYEERVERGKVVKIPDVAFVT